RASIASHSAEVFLARTRQSPQLDGVSRNQREFLRPRPPLELSLSANRLGEEHWSLDIDEPDVGVVVGMLAAETETVFSDALSHIAPFADVERSAGVLQNVSEGVTVDRIGAGNLVRHLE